MVLGLVAPEDERQKKIPIAFRALGDDGAAA